MNNAAVDTLGHDDPWYICACSPVGICLEMEFLGHRASLSSTSVKKVILFSKVAVPG